MITRQRVFLKCHWKVTSLLEMEKQFLPTHISQKHGGLKIQVCVCTYSGTCVSGHLYERANFSQVYIPIRMYSCMPSMNSHVDMQGLKCGLLVCTYNLLVATKWENIRAQHYHHWLQGNYMTLMWISSPHQSLACIGANGRSVLPMASYLQASHVINIYTTE